MTMDIIKPNDPQFKEVLDKIRNDDRYWPYFKECIGVIDGTHIPVVVPRDRQIPYIGRKGMTTQNVMVVCDFNMRFMFTWAGWECAAHDAQTFFKGIKKAIIGFSSSTQRFVNDNIKVDFVIKFLLSNIYFLFLFCK